MATHSSILFVIIIFFTLIGDELLYNGLLYSGFCHTFSLQYSCLENPMDRGAWRATVMGLQRVSSDMTEQQSTSLTPNGWAQEILLRKLR